MKTREGKKPAPRWQRCRYLCRNAPKFFLIVRLKAYLEALLCKGESFEKKPKNLQKNIPNLTLYHTFIKIIELILGHFTEKLYFCLNFNKESTWKITINLWLATNLLTGAL